MEIVKYHNDLNNVIFKTYNLKDLDLFFAIAYKMKETTKAVFKVEEIKKLSTDNTHLDRFYKSLDNVFKTQLQIRTKTVISDFNLFITKELDLEKEEIRVELHPMCQYILCNLVKNYTKFELADFKSLKSEYSKTLFRLLKQYSDTGKLIIPIQDFRTIFDIPEIYQQGNIDQKVLIPAIKECSKYFKNLKYQKEKLGIKVSKIIFTFTKKSENRIDNAEEINKEYDANNTDTIENLFKLCKERTDSVKVYLSQIIEKYSFEVIESNIEYTNKYSNENYIIYLKQAIKADYAKDEREKKQVEIEKQSQRKQAEEDEENRKKILINQKYEEYMSNAKKLEEMKMKYEKAKKNLKDITFNGFVKATIEIEFD